MKSLILLVMIAQVAHSAPAVKKVLELSSRINFNCAILDNGIWLTPTTPNYSIKCWGINQNGQLGIPPSGNVLIAPTTINLSNLGQLWPKSVGAGKNHACALLSDATVACWGNNEFGQLGRGGLPTGSTNFIQPQRVKLTVSPLQYLTGVTKISTGENHTCAIHGISSEVSCWGNNNGGRLGNALTAPYSTTPVKVQLHGSPTNLSGAQKIFASLWHSCAIVGTYKNVYCWGSNGDGQLGIGSFGSTYKAKIASNGFITISLPSGPITIPSPVADIEHIGLTAYSTCFVNTSKRTLCVGSNKYGQLGSGIGGFPSPANGPFARSAIFSYVMEPGNTPTGLNMSGTFTIGGSSNNQFFCASNDQYSGQLKTVCWGLVNPLFGTTIALFMGISPVFYGAAVYYPTAQPREVNYAGMNPNTGLGDDTYLGQIAVGSQHACQIVHRNINNANPSIPGDYVDAVVCWGSGYNSPNFDTPVSVGIF